MACTDIAIINNSSRLVLETLWRTGQSIKDTIVDGLLDKRGTSTIRLEPHIAGALAREGAWNPRVGVIEVPKRDTNAGLLSDASGGDAVVVLDLLDLVGVAQWDVTTDVKLGDGDIDAKGGEGLDVGLKAGLAWGLADLELSQQKTLTGG
jgi:hypothetical protein